LTYVPRVQFSLAAHFFFLVFQSIFGLGTPK
jgi:hypothetical protein